MPQSHKKDLDAVLDYGINWGTNWLDTDSGEIISASTWTVPSGITKDSDSKTDTTTTIWLSGGIAGQSYALINHIETNASPVRKDDRTIYIYVVER